MPEFKPSYSYQFEVTDQGDSVYKRLMSQAESEAQFRRYGRSIFFTVDFTGLANTAIDHAATGLRNLKGLIEEYPELRSTLANPVIEDNGNYSQDKVNTLGRALRKESTRGARYLIDQYVDLSLLHISYGFMERVFKVTANCGVDDDNKVVLIDLGELCFDKEEAVGLARIKRWQKSEAYLYPLSFPKDFALPNHLKPYYRRRMLSQFTAPVVEQTWQQSIKHNA